MVFFMGRRSMKFYMPVKPTKWGFKIHSLFDSKAHYLYDIIFDSAKNYKELVAPDTEITFAFQIAINLVDILPRNGFTLFFDSWYSSINLGQELIKKGFNFVKI